MFETLRMNLLALFTSLFTLIALGGCNGEPPTEAEIARRSRMETLLRAAKPGYLVLRPEYERDGVQYYRVCVLAPEMDKVEISGDIWFRCNLSDVGYIKQPVAIVAQNMRFIQDHHHTSYATLAKCMFLGRYVYGPGNGGVATCDDK